MKTGLLILPVVALLSVVFNAEFSNAAAQGSLTPPGSPAPGMLTLSQIEPRTPISSAPYAISRSGSFYLTTNLTVSSGDAIDVYTNGVTLDLNGFTISSTAASATGTAILLNGTITNIAIYNGQISSGVTNSDSGSYAGGGFLSGISGNSMNLRVRSVSVTGVLDYGIYAGFNSTIVEACSVNVAGAYGICAATVSDSTVLSAGTVGIYCDVANNCYATEDGGGEGIYAENETQNCYGSSSGGGYGLFAGAGAENCNGASVSSYGISSPIMLNCFGQSNSGIAMSGTLAENCFAYTASGEYALSISIAENCFGENGGSGVGIEAGYLANACSGYSASGVGRNALIASVCHGTTGTGTPLATSHNVNSF